MGFDRQTKLGKYAQLSRQIELILENEIDPIIWMSTLACLIKTEFDFLWVGFYLQREGELTIGPYQGNLACLRIPSGQGVCGASVRRKGTIVVDDVHQFPGHIACDDHANSEIVIPVFDDEQNLRAVLDIDSSDFRSFDEYDKEFLEGIVVLMRSLEWSRLD